MYTCVVYVYIYIAESDSIYSFSPNRKMGVVYFGWKRHGKGCVSYPLWFLLCRVDWTKKTCADFLGRYFTSVHVRPSVCIVYFIQTGRCTRCCSTAWEGDQTIGVSELGLVFSPIG